MIFYMFCVNLTLVELTHFDFIHLCISLTLVNLFD